MAPRGELRHNTFMQLSMKALGADLTLPYYDNIHVMMTQLMSQTLTMHCMLMQCAGVSTWESQPMHMAPRGALSPPFWPHHTAPRPRNTLGR